MIVIAGQLFRHDRRKVDVRKKARTGAHIISMIQSLVVQVGS